MTRIPACFAENPSEASRDLLSVAPVGVDAHIDPLGSYEFAEDYRKKRHILPVWVGIGPYSQNRAPSVKQPPLLSSSGSASEPGFSRRGR